MVKLLESLIEGDTERKGGCRSTEEMLRAVSDCNIELETED